MLSRLYLTTIIGLAAALWAVALVLEGVSLSMVWLRPFSLVIGALVLLLLAFEKWAWRFRFLHPWFVAKPNLHGTWKGEIVSCWKDSNGQAVAPIEAYLIIRQTFLTMRLRLLTKESHSDAIIASIVEEAGGTHTIVGTYLNAPNIMNRDKSPIHHGSVQIRVVGNRANTLEGDYWTDRNTKGTLRFTGRTSRLIYDYVEASGAKYRKRP